jgi:hypothetical protein
MEEQDVRHQRKIETYKSRIDLVTNKCARTLVKTHVSFNNLKMRRSLEIEGFTNDIGLLRRQLKTLEKHIMKFGPVEDREKVILAIGASLASLPLFIVSSGHGRKSGQDFWRIVWTQGILLFIIIIHIHIIQAHMYHVEKEVHGLAM